MHRFGGRRIMRSLRLHLMHGDADIATPAALLADPSRARVVLALADGRALPASVLAAEAGVAASTASEHLTKLVSAGMLCVERHGRHRYYRVASGDVVGVLEALARIAPTARVTSLRQHTRAHALRRARLCYDHLAGRLGVTLMRALITQGMLEAGDGAHHPRNGATDRLSAPGHDVEYRLTDPGSSLLTEFGLDLDALSARRRPLIRYCLDWTEQRHHLAGALGAAVTARLFELDWVRRTPQHRAVQLTDQGRAGLHARFGIELESGERDDRDVRLNG
jgi:DNA-binding transcriptional ArsR family regulator